MSPIYLASLIVQFLGLLLHVIGLGTPEWSFVPDDVQTYGLWEECIPKYGCVNIYMSKSSKLMATEAFAILGLFFGFAALALAIVFIVLPVFGKSGTLKITAASMGTAIFALICNFIAVVIWGAGIHDPDTQTIGYSFVFCITGGILMAIGGVLTFVGGTLDED